MTFFAVDALNEQGRARHRCDKCGLITSPIQPASASRVRHVCRNVDVRIAAHSTHGLPPKRSAGPGTELKQLLFTLGLKPQEGCKCRERMRQMDRWGIKGCREHFAEIRAWLVEARGKATWAETLRAATAVLYVGLPIDPLDVEGSLIRIAIDRAEARPATQEKESS